MSALRRSALSMLSPSGSRARLAILTYHRVLQEPDPLQADEPDARLFDRQMSWLAQNFHVLPLPDAVDRLRRGSLPSRAVCVTFDDGYANNLEVALPILQRHGIAATVFVAVDAVERGLMWNDLVIEAVRRCKSDANLARAGFEGLSAANDGARAHCVAQLLQKLKYLPLAERWERAARLFRELADADPPRLMMTPQMVRALGQAGVDIGAHTVNHPILMKLDDATARSEIVGSRQWVRDMTGTAPRSFAYPNGRPGLDYDRRHAEMVRDAGFDLAVSTLWACASQRSDVYELPRIAPWDRTKDRFCARIARSYVTSYLRKAPTHAREC